MLLRGSQLKSGRTEDAASVLRASPEICRARATSCLTSSKRLALGSTLRVYVNITAELREYYMAFGIF